LNWTGWRVAAATCWSLSSLGPLQRYLRLSRGDVCVEDEAKKIGKRCVSIVDATQLTQACCAKPIDARNARILSQRFLCALKSFLVATGNEKREFA
jgi:hypothetical protein